MIKLEDRLKHLLESADIQINGNRGWDIQVHEDKFYHRVLTQGSLGLGESYMDNWWDAEALDQLFYKILISDIKSKVKPKSRLWRTLQSKFINLQNMRRSFYVGQHHYDIGNDLFECMLDERLTYTCGYWKKASTLNQAQEDKLELVCRKIGLKKHQRILDIGCGWGSFIKYAVQHYGVQAVGITVSQEQAEYARKNCRNMPVEIRQQDYRELNEKFDHIVSLGMFEHVGPKNHKAYMRVASRCLKDDGLFLLHTIGVNSSHYEPDPWFDKYIFPHGVLPSMQAINTAYGKHFILEDKHSFGLDYDKTLMAWFENFEARWDTLSGRYSDEFYRMWKYYLLCCAGAFRARNLQLWQFVFSKHGVAGGYSPIR